MHIRNICRYLMVEAAGSVYSYLHTLPNRLPLVFVVTWTAYDSCNFLLAQIVSPVPSLSLVALLGVCNVRNIGLSLATKNR